MAVIVFIVFSVALIELFPSLLDWADVSGGARLITLGARWVILGSMMVVLLGALYRLGPKRESPELAWVSVGTLAAALWVVMSVVFGLCVQHFGSYNATYGSLGTVITFAMWLYLSAYIILMAGELNCELEHERLADSTIGQNEPMGRRGAHVADRTAHVADRTAHVADRTAHVADRTAHVADRAAQAADRTPQDAA